MSNDDFISIFSSEDEHPEVDISERLTWKIAVVDDERSIIDVTRLALKDLEIEGRYLQFIEANSAAAGYQLLCDHPDTAVILLDVVMETPDAGLRLVDTIREKMANHMIQIVLRTGQAGYAPEEEVIKRYEINAYKTKSELTRSKLFTTIATAIRSYKHLQMLHESRQGLRAVIDASAQMLSERSVQSFSAGVLRQIDALFGMASHSFFCVSRRPAAGPFVFKNARDGFVVVAANAQFSDWYGKTIEDLDQDSAYVEITRRALQHKAHQFTTGISCLYLHTPSGWEGAVVAGASLSLQAADPELLQVFCLNVGLGLENAKYFTYLNQAAFKDELTGLLNRHGVIEAACQSTKQFNTAVEAFVIDVDYFHHIVESLGYVTGNLMLKKIAAVLAEFFGERAAVCRLHADVFAAVLPSNGLSARDVAVRCAKPLTIDGQSIRLGLTVGKSAAFFCHQYEHGELLLRQAEIALKVAKESKRGAGQLFEQRFEHESRRNMTLLSDLRQALERQELFLVLQPKVDVTRHNQICGFEALLRWSHPEQGLISPMAFIPIVEKSGLNYDLDLYVAERLCQLMLAAPANKPRISFNISANSLHHDGFVDDLIDVFQRHKISFAEVEIEVTENALIQSEQAILALRRLYQAGFIICLDDFGAGFSSLSYLLRLPLHVIKIDRAFVADLTVNGDSQKILYGMLAIIRSVGKGVVIEGVETAEQVQMLVALGIEVIQGFYFYQPLPVATAWELSVSNTINSED